MGQAHTEFNLAKDQKRRQQLIYFWSKTVWNTEKISKAQNVWQ